MKKRLAVAAAALMFAGLGASVVQAAPGPNDKNNHGLCTAYFNGQKEGHNKGGKASPAPFAALEGERTLQEIFDFCGGAEGIGGNPDENGRFTQCFTNSDDDDTNDCEDG